MKLKIKPYTLQFKFSAKTSRGAMAERKVWFIELTTERGGRGIGEVAPIARLSPEDPGEISDRLDQLADYLKGKSVPLREENIYEWVASVVPPNFPSIRFGLEMALLDLMNGGAKKIFSTSPESVSLPINGLVWMGDEAFMREQIKEKLDQGFTCIKLKIGSLDFDVEKRIIRDVRSISEDLIIRLDANGAFRTEEVLAKLKELSRFGIHSIEQPIMPRQPEAMELICNKSDIPIALDEELIGIASSRERIDVLQDLKPQYLVLKPTLHGGFSSVAEWIDLAQIHGINWWITSYLESNIGLNAIAQFASTYLENKEHHGLGTGSLYHNNIASPILIEKGYFSYDPSSEWENIHF